MDEPNRSRLLVLVIDDDPVTRSLVQIALKKDYTVEEAEDGERGVSAFGP